MFVLADFRIVLFTTTGRCPVAVPTGEILIKTQEFSEPLFVFISCFYYYSVRKNCFFFFLFHSDTYPHRRSVYVCVYFSGMYLYNNITLPTSKINSHIMTDATMYYTTPRQYEILY